MKDKILYMYFDKKMSISSIAKNLSKSRTSIYSVLKRDSRYKFEKMMRDYKKNTKIKEKERIVKDYFYEKGMKVCAISKQLQVSASLVTRIIKSDNRYENEKERRKKESQKIKREKSKLAMQKRRSKISEEDMRILIMLQRQNSIAMSRKNKLSNRAIVLVNINHYKYNSQNKKLEFIASSGVKPNDLPDNIKI